MLFIKNCSSKVIHVGNRMILPDERIEDTVVDGLKLSDNASVGTLLDLGYLELVDVVEVPKKTGSREARVETVEVDAPLDVADSTPEQPEQPEQPKQPEQPAPDSETKSQQRRRRATSGTENS